MLVGGAVADRVDRRRILLTSQVLQMTFAAALGAALRRRPPRASCAILVHRLPHRPHAVAVGADLPGRAHEPGAAGADPERGRAQLAAVQPLARDRARRSRALLLARGGTGACFVVNALSFLAVIVALWRIELPPPAAPRRRRAWRRAWRDGPAPRAGEPARCGCSRCWRRRPASWRFPLDHLPAGDRGRRAGHRRRRLQPAALQLRRGRDRGRRWPRRSAASAPGRGRLLLVGFVVYGVATLARGRSRATRWLSMALLFVAGSSLVTAFSTLNSLVQENAPDALQGPRPQHLRPRLPRRHAAGQPGRRALLARPLGAPPVIGAFSRRCWPSCARSPGLREPRLRGV